MLRLRFTSGLALGLAVGVPLGALITLLLTPSPRDDSTTATSLQVLELTRKLDLANEARERMERQLEQFTGIANQMTASFNTLEARFKALEEAQRAGDGHAPPTAAPPLAQAPAAGPDSGALGPAGDQLGGTAPHPPAHADNP